MSPAETQIIAQRVLPGRPLGRHVQHDPRSRGFPAPEARTVVSILHRRHCPPFVQQVMNACTGFAVAGLLMSDPFFQRGRPVTEHDAVDLYSKATHEDPFPGTYPPDDRGSTGLAAMKAARTLSYITGYSHAFGLEHALRALALAPVITGVPWYESFDTPNKDGLVTIGGQVQGGHEFEVLGIDADNHTVRACNSWGPEWGDDGYFTLSWETWDRLLTERGDVTTASL